jgi:hypothetical protein
MGVFLLDGVLKIGSDKLGYKLVYFFCHFSIHTYFSLQVAVECKPPQWMMVRDFSLR